MEVRGAITGQWSDLMSDYNTEALVFPFGPAPIFTREYQAAMRLAEYCYPIPRPPVAGCWELARKRR